MPFSAVRSFVRSFVNQTWFNSHFKAITAGLTCSTLCKFNLLEFAFDSKVLSEQSRFSSRYWFFAVAERTLLKWRLSPESSEALICFSLSLSFAFHGTQSTTKSITSNHVNDHEFDHDSIRALKRLPMNFEMITTAIKASMSAVDRWRIVFSSPACTALRTSTVSAVAPHSVGIM